MPIRVTCPTCSKAFKAPESSAGRSGKCPGCGGQLTVPDDGFEQIAAMAVAPPPPPPPRTQQCPYCAETVLLAAKKCRHCGEVIDDKMRAEQERHRRSEIEEIKKAAKPKPSPGVAMVLSLIVPGLGQLYKGQVISAACWFAITVIGYAFLVVPGVLLHIWCVLGAGFEGITRRAD